MSLTSAIESIEGEFRLLQGYRIFNKDELQKYKKTRIEFERQVQELAEIPLNILTEYIQHLEMYIQAATKRFKEIRNMSLPQAFKIDVLQRMKLLHELRINFYGLHDYIYLSKYIKFCSLYNMMQDVKVFLIKEYPKNVKIWTAAADILVKDFQNRIAVEFLTTALENNSSNEAFYKQIIGIELDAAARSSRKIYLKKCTSRLIEMLKKLFKEEHSVEYCMSILEIILRYTFMTELQQFCSEQIILTFPNNPDVWNQLAQSELLDDDDDDIRISGVNNSQTPSNADPVTKFKACIQKYKQGLDTIADNTKPQLWLLYIDFLIKASLDLKNKYGEDLKYDALTSALEEGCNFITEEQYLLWIERLNDEDNILLVNIALRVHPNSAKLWRARMYYETLDENEERLNNIFQEGREILQENSYLLWESFTTFHALYSSTDKLISIFEEGIKEHQNISNKLKPQYVEWLAITLGIEQARKLYCNIAETPPFCKKLHLAMLKMEEYQSVHNYEIMDAIFQTVTKQFKTDIDIWFKYVKFKVSCFNFKYRDETITEHLVELRADLKDICKMAKPGLSIHSYAKLKLHCLEQ